MLYLFGWAKRIIQFVRWRLRRTVERFVDSYWERRKPEAFTRLRRWRGIRYRRAVDDGTRQFILAVRRSLYEDHPLTRLMLDR